MDVATLQSNSVTVSTVPTTPSQEVPADQRELIQAVKALNATEMFGQDCELTFVFDRETRQPLVRIIDRKTNEIIRQIPPEYALRMAEYLKLDSN